MSDEELYLEATREVENEDINPALWAKVLTLSEGNEDNAKYKYINLRVEQLAKSKKEQIQRNQISDFKAITRNILKILKIIIGLFFAFSSISSLRVFSSFNVSFGIGIFQALIASFLLYSAFKDKTIDSSSNEQHLLEKTDTPEINNVSSPNEQGCVAFLVISGAIIIGILISFLSR